MSSCEKCWTRAKIRHLGDRSKSITDHYYDIMREVQGTGPHCTPEEQAGQFWDEEKQCDSRDI